VCALWEGQFPIDTELDVHNTRKSPGLRRMLAAGEQQARDCAMQVDLPVIGEKRRRSCVCKWTGRGCGGEAGNGGPAGQDGRATGAHA